MHLCVSMCFCLLFLGHCLIRWTEMMWCCSACLIPFCNTENIACQCYQSCVSRPTREPDGLNKSNMMQEHASCLSKCFTHPAVVESKCLSELAWQLFLCGPVFRKLNPVIIIYLFKKKQLHKHHLTKPSSLWMVIPGRTASRGNANKWRADREAGVFNIQHV